MKNQFFAAVASIALLLSGCTIHRFGEARIQNNSDLAGITADAFTLPAVPLGQAGTHTLHVRDLPFAIYPTHLMIALTPAEAALKEHFPWDDAKVRVDFRATNGQVFFSEEIALREARRGLSPGAAHQLELQFRPAPERPWRAPEDMPSYTSYDVVVDVLQPSANKNHRARLYANVYVR